ncbi:THAP-type domain-containing protein [Caerostris extrusa]|uniref:THAP-type domain-containing protein n=1 Tax=Caerostris extrusa TaxID=172846 RepID=A0AAV4TU35_CAEEX|nr:THAP-type domain-containing protein [Caerostris extrusa]
MRGVKISFGFGFNQVVCKRRLIFGFCSNWSFQQSGDCLCLIGRGNCYAVGVRFERSNYDPTVYISCFQFPKEEDRRNLWLKKINRKDCSPAKNAVVCIKHFSEKFVITEDHAVRDDGSVLTVKRIYPKFTPDAYPPIFPNHPAYLSSDPVSKRKTPSERRNEILKRDEKKFTDWCLKDIIKTFDDFRKEFPTKLTKEWLFTVQEDVLFYKLNICNGQAPRIKVSYKVDRNLSVTAWHGEIALSNKSLHILQGNKCDRWTKFDCLLSTLGNYEEKNVCFEDKFNYTLNFLQDVRKQKEKKEDEILVTAPKPCCFASPYTPSILDSRP